MVKKYLDWLKANTTKGEFKEILEMVEQDIKFNRVGFHKITSAKEFIAICQRSRILITG